MIPYKMRPLKFRTWVFLLHSTSWKIESICLLVEIARPQQYLCLIIMILEGQTGLWFTKKKYKCNWFNHWLASRMSMWVRINGVVKWEFSMLLYYFSMHLKVAPICNDVEWRQQLNLVGCCCCNQFHTTFTFSHHYFFSIATTNI